MPAYGRRHAKSKLLVIRAGPPETWPIENLIRSIDRFHVEDGGYEFSLNKVLFSLYAIHLRWR